MTHSPLHPASTAHVDAARHDARSTGILSDLMFDLPRLSTSHNGIVDFCGSPPEAVERLNDNAQLAIQVVLQGISATGLLLARVSFEVEPDRCEREAMEALGVLQSELGDLSLMLVKLKDRCRDALAQR